MENEKRGAAPVVDAAELGKLKALAEAAGGDEWSDDEDVVFGADGGSVCICHANIGALPNAVYPDHRAAFIAAANPDAILRIAALVAQQAARIEELQQDLNDARRGWESAASENVARQPRAAPEATSEQMGGAQVAMPIGFISHDALTELQDPNAPDNPLTLRHSKSKHRRAEIPVYLGTPRAAEGEATSERKPLTDAEIVQRTEDVAAALAKFDGFAFSGKSFRESPSPRAIAYWKKACIAQEILTATDPMDAVAELEDAQHHGIGGDK